jgi:hypothetical protein
MCFGWGNPFLFVALTNQVRVRFVSSAIRGLSLIVPIQYGNPTKAVCWNPMAMLYRYRPLFEGK